MRKEEDMSDDKIMNTGTPYQDPYNTLGVAHTATADEIKQAYFAQVRQHPPERDPVMFKKIRAAYDQLKTPDKRFVADMYLLEELPALPERPVLELDLSVHPDDVLTLARFGTDLTRQDFSADFREMSL